MHNAILHFSIHVYVIALTTNQHICSQHSSLMTTSRMNNVKGHSKRSTKYWWKWKKCTKGKVETLPMFLPI